MNKLQLAFATALAFALSGLAPAAPVAAVAGNQTSVGLSVAQRQALIARIVGKWGPYVQQVHRTSASGWANRMQATFDAASDTNLQRATTMTTFQGMVDTLTGLQLSDARVIDALAIRSDVLKSQSGTEVLGSVTADLVYTPLAPCRIVDTRVVGGPIASGTSRGFHGYTTTDFSGQGGISGSTCGIPANPSALMMNVTVVAPTAAGYLTVWPYGTTMPFASSLNYPVGAIVGNQTAAEMTLGSPFDEFSVFASGNGNVVIDVVGYFMAPQATAVDCTAVPGQVTLASNAFSELTISCPAGRTVTGGGCGNPAANNNSLPITFSASILLQNQWACGAVNTAPNSQILMGSAMCCRVPGR